MQCGRISCWYNSESSDFDCWHTVPTTLKEESLVCDTDSNHDTVFESFFVCVCVWWGDFPPFHHLPVFDYLLPALLPFIFTSVFVCISTIIWLKEESYFTLSMLMRESSVSPCRSRGLHVTCATSQQILPPIHPLTYRGRKIWQKFLQSGRLKESVLRHTPSSQNKSLELFVVWVLLINGVTVLWYSCTCTCSLSLSFLQLGVGFIEKFRFVCKPLIFFSMTIIIYWKNVVRRFDWPRVLINFHCVSSAA